MVDLSAKHAGLVGESAASVAIASRPGRRLSRAWKAVERFASVRTADELGVLAERYQNSQPALAARFRAAASVATARRA